MKLNVKAFALAWGGFWGLSGIFLPWWIILFDGFTGEPILAAVFRGYNVSPIGSIVGLAWGFVGGAVSGAVSAWFYNFLVTVFAKK